MNLPRACPGIPCGRPHKARLRRKFASEQRSRHAVNDNAASLGRRGSPESGQLKNQGVKMSIGTILLIVLVLALLGVIPTWRHSKNWGYGPSGGVGLIVVILIVLLVTGN